MNLFRFPLLLFAFLFLCLVSVSFAESSTDAATTSEAATSESPSTTTASTTSTVTTTTAVSTSATNTTTAHPTTANVTTASVTTSAPTTTTTTTLAPGGSICGTDCVDFVKTTDVNVVSNPRINAQNYFANFYMWIPSTANFSAESTQYTLSLTFPTGFSLETSLLKLTAISGSHLTTSACTGNAGCLLSGSGLQRTATFTTSLAANTNYGFKFVKTDGSSSILHFPTYSDLFTIAGVLSDNAGKSMHLSFNFTLQPGIIPALSSSDLTSFRPHSDVVGSDSNLYGYILGLPNGIPLSGGIEFMISNATSTSNLFNKTSIPCCKFIPVNSVSTVDPTLAPSGLNAIFRDACLNTADRTAGYGGFCSDTDCFGTLKLTFGSDVEVAINGGFYITCKRINYQTPFGLFSMETKNANNHLIDKLEPTILAVPTKYYIRQYPSASVSFNLLLAAFLVFISINLL